MRKLSLIGIGTGNPDHLTFEAAEALRQVDVFFVIDKGSEKADLAALRTEICRRHRPDGAYRTVTLRDPERDRSPDDYGATVRLWHEQRAALVEEALIENLEPGQRGAFLIWGDPSLYDSTLRVIDRIVAAGRVGVEVEMIPGISSVQVLTARHRIPVNRVGEAVHITTGRKLAAGEVPDRGDLVVMLDGVCAFAGVAEPAQFEIFWGAYLGTSDELLISGPLPEVTDRIREVRAEARSRHGWIMDIYLLRRRGGG